MKSFNKKTLLHTSHLLEAQLVKLGGLSRTAHASPDEALGELFSQVQMSKLYGDGKTFVDLVPTRRVKRIIEEYELRRHLPDFNLKEFVRQHFYVFGAEPEGGYISNPKNTPLEHISELWKVLERRNSRSHGSLLALPYSYVTPGGRFREQFYWDSYFIMLGLAVENNYSLIEGMVRNYSHQIRQFGFIPTANRSYFLSRSQPPFFSYMIELLGVGRGRRTSLIRYLPYLLTEHRFWMKSDFPFRLKALPDFHRVVRLPGGETLNRYYDNKKTPRPESYKDDVDTTQSTENREIDQMYLDLRAAAESGWDFSSRWFKKPNDITSIRTTDFVPVDLNCLLYHLEVVISEAYNALLQPLFARQFKNRARARKQAILKYCWSEKKHFFFDYNFKRHCRSPALTVAGMFPLFVGIASEKQAKQAAGTLRKFLLKPGGVVTSVHDTGQQWDAPNGWAPMQWIVIQGLKRYGFEELAEDIAQRWVKTNLSVYEKKHKMVEKYDVSGASSAAGGGEYPLQDGFGWTNGVLQALLRQYEAE